MAEKINIPLTIIARVGIWLSNPFSGGIRQAINNGPSKAHIAARAQCMGQPIPGGEKLILDEYEHKVRDFLTIERGRAELLEQNVITNDEVTNLGFAQIKA